MDEQVELVAQRAVGDVRDRNHDHADADEKAPVQPDSGSVDGHHVLDAERREQRREEEHRRDKPHERHLADSGQEVQRVGDPGADVRERSDAVPEQCEDQDRQAGHAVPVDAPGHPRWSPANERPEDHDDRGRAEKRELLHEVHGEPTDLGMHDGERLGMRRAPLRPRERAREEGRGWDDAVGVVLAVGDVVRVEPAGQGHELERNE